MEFIHHQAKNHQHFLMFRCDTNFPNIFNQIANEDKFPLISPINGSYGAHFIRYSPRIIQSHTNSRPLIASQFQAHGALLSTSHALIGMQYQHISAHNPLISASYKALLTCRIVAMIATMIGTIVATIPPIIGTIMPHTSNIQAHDQRI